MKSKSSPSPEESRRSGEGLASAITISLLSMLLYVNTLNHQFVYDDRPAILDNALVTGAGAGSLLTSDYWGVPLSHSGSHKSYRPLTSLSFRLNYLMSGPDPRSFHLTNVLLHGLVSLLFMRLVTSLPGLTRSASLVTGLAWAVAPVHTEAVTGVVGRADILASLLSLVTIAQYQARGWSLVTPLLAALAMLAKEQGVTVLGICFTLELCDPRRRPEQRRRSLLRLGLSCVILLSLRAAFLGGGLPSFSKADNPASHCPSLVTRLLTFLYLPVFNLQLLLMPSTLSYDWSMSSIPLVTSITDPRNVLSLGLYSPLACLAAKLMFRLYTLHSPTFHSLWRSNLSKAPRPGGSLTTSQIEAISIIALALSLIILPFLPAANLFFYVGFVVAERLLYLPSLGLCLLLGLGYQRLTAHQGRCKVLAAASRVGLLIMILSSAARTVLRNQDWRDEETLFRSGLQVNPPKSFSNLGNILYAKGRVDEAEVCFKEAIRHRPNMADTHYNLGILLQKSDRLPEAVSAYSSAISFRPKLALAHLNLGLTLSKLGRTEEAIKILHTGSKLDDNGLKDPKTNANARSSALWHLGKLLLETGDPGQAVTVLQTGVKDHRESGGRSLENILNLLGEAHQALGHQEDAEAWYSSALEADPHYVPAQLMMAKMLAKNESRNQEAESWFLRAKSSAPGDPSVYAHYGLYLLDLERFPEAASILGKAAALNPANYDTVFNAAVAARQAGHHDRAEEFYRRTVELRPMEAGAHLNLGALLHLRGKLRQAEAAYAEAWRLRPGDPSTRTNIQRLHNVMRKKNVTISRLADL